MRNQKNAISAALIVVSIILFGAAALSFGEEAKIVLTPKPGPAPRISGARVFGVPARLAVLIHRIAATGDRPMTFSADSLPPRA